MLLSILKMLRSLKYTCKGHRQNLWPRFLQKDSMVNANGSQCENAVGIL